jgi:hypothetical protein
MASEFQAVLYVRSHAADAMPGACNNASAASSIMKGFSPIFLQELMIVSFLHYRAVLIAGNLWFGYEDVFTSSFYRRRV